MCAERQQEGNDDRRAGERTDESLGDGEDAEAPIGTGAEPTPIGGRRGEAW
jgi:hypothetical protein